MKALLLAASLAAAAWAQTLTEPPPLIRAVRRPGIDLAAVRPYAEGRAGVHVIGMAAVTGPLETWLIELEGSFGEIERVDRALRSVARVRAPDLVAPPATLIGIYRPGLSYRPDQAIRLFGKARYFYVSIYQVAAGARGDFTEAVRARRASYDFINLDRPDIAYQIVSGTPWGMYVFLAPLPSLAILDEALAHVGEAPHAAKASGDQVTREHLLFRVEPAMSYVSDEFASADPDFWRVK